jgi:hypothetical protein
VIYQKKSPKTVIPIRLKNENYDFACKDAGELSIAAYVNQLIEKRQSDTASCNSDSHDNTIGANNYVR